MKTKKRIDWNALSAPLLLLGVLVLLLVISARHTLRVDLTERRLYSLSEKTENVLAMLQGPLVARAFYEDGAYGRSDIEELLREYRYFSPRFRYELIDPSRNPSLVESFDVRSGGTIVLEYEGRRRTVISREEEEITNAILRLVSDAEVPLYFVTGHGEKNPSNGYGELAQALAGERYAVQEFVPLQSDAIPEDAACLVIAGPRTELIPHEIEQIDTYLQRGGSLLLLLDPYYDGGLAPLLERIGIIVRDDAIVDRQSRLMGGDFLFPIVTQYEPHRITDGVTLASFYPVTRSLELRQEGPVRQVAALAKTGREAYGETDRDLLADGTSAFDPERDIPGPLVLAAAATPEAGDGQEARVVVFGDSDFASDDYLDVSGNRDVMLNTLAWLTGEEELLSIRPRERAHTPMVLTRGRLRLVLWLSVFLMPALAAAGGVAVLLFRRRYR